MSLICNDDIFDYITNHIHIEDYNKLKSVSIRFKSVFNINNKNYSELIPIKGCCNKTIMNIIEKRIFNKYYLTKSNINKSLLHHYWYRTKQCYMSNIFNNLIASNCCVYIECLIALLYNSEYTKHRNIIEIFNNILNNIVLYPINNKEKQTNILRLIKACFIILDFQKMRERRGDKKTARYSVYNINICVYISILVKAIHTSINTYTTLNQSGINRVFIIANEKLEYYKNTINDNPKYKKIFPIYYLKYIKEEIIDKSYIDVN
jgi:hypothetical protein